MVKANKAKTARRAKKDRKGNTYKHTKKANKAQTRRARKGGKSSRSKRYRKRTGGARKFGRKGLEFPFLSRLPPDKTLWLKREILSDLADREDVDLMEDASKVIAAAERVEVLAANYKKYISGLSILPAVQSLDKKITDFLNEHPLFSKAINPHRFSGELYDTIQQMKSSERDNFLLQAIWGEVIHGGMMNALTNKGMAVAYTKKGADASFENLCAIGGIDINNIKESIVSGITNGGYLNDLEEYVDVYDFRTRFLDQTNQINSEIWEKMKELWEENELSKYLYLVLRNSHTKNKESERIAEQFYKELQALESRLSSEKGFSEALDRFSDLYTSADKRYKSGLGAPFPGGKEEQAMSFPERFAVHQQEQQQQQLAKSHYQDPVYQQFQRDELLETVKEIREILQTRLPMK